MAALTERTDSPQRDCLQNARRHICFFQNKKAKSETLEEFAAGDILGVPTFLPPKIPAKDLRGCCYSRSSPLSVDHVFIEGISASETGHLHDFGNRVVLGL